MAGIQPTGEDWTEVARYYKQLSVGVSQKPVAALIARTNALLPFSRATAIHDNGAGPGTIIRQVIDEYGTSLPADCVLTASDYAPAMVEQINKTKDEETTEDPHSPWSRLDASVLDATDMAGVADGSKSHVTAGWIYMLTADPPKCLSETRRILQPGGVLGLSSWKENEWMSLMSTPARVRADVTPMELPEVWRSADGVKGQMEEQGFRDVESFEVPVEMSFDSYEGLADFFMTKLPYVSGLLKDFDNEERRKVRELMISELKERAPSEPGTLNGVALVAVGRK